MRVGRSVLGLFAPRISGTRPGDSGGTTTPISRLSCRALYEGSIMAIECVAYRDSKGGLHSSPEKATLEDLAAVLGRVGDEGGMTSGVARMIFDKRAEIERVFAEHDALLASAAGSAADADASGQPENGTIRVVSSELP